MIFHWQSALLSSSASIREALVQLGDSKLHILMVVDDDGRLLGTVTDGDIRRGILKDTPLDQPAVTVMNPHPSTISPHTPRNAALRLMKERNIQQLPVVEDGRVVGLFTLEDFIDSAEERPNWVVIMAGGKGQRLRPLTETVPKPMLPVGGRPILETIIAQLGEHGLRRLYLSVNYKAEIIKNHFGDGSHFGCEIRYLEEAQPLGTAGPLTLLPERVTEPLVVMNGDVLTKVDFGNMLAYHGNTGACATIGVRQIDVQVPYGVLDIDEQSVRAIVEKPVHKFQVSAGVYVFDPSVPPHVPAGQATDMPDVIRTLVDDGQPVSAFPIHEYWIDVGQIPELNRAMDDFNEVFP
jgi:dTDP-glucose pyrophosphorylase/predicted transcriptional regulator